MSRSAKLIYRPEAMTVFDHDACDLFETHCRNRGIPPRPISVSRRSRVRRPDFAIQIGRKTVVVEIKALELSNVNP